jgi:hypothetical protein
MKMVVFWDLAPCRLVDTDISYELTAAIIRSDTSAYRCSSNHFVPGEISGSRSLIALMLMAVTSSEICLLFTSLHSALFQKTTHPHTHHHKNLQSHKLSKLLPMTYYNAEKTMNPAANFTSLKAQ